MTTKEIRNKLEQMKGRKLQIEESLRQARNHLREQRRSLHRHEEAREIIREVGLKTQQQLQFHIADIASMALESVFPDPYELKVLFEEKRNKLECELSFVKDGNEVDPKDASGVGAVDIASFALRIASWTMAKPRPRNVIILDEPFRCLDKPKHVLASAMIQELSKKLGLQFIIVTHEESLSASADRTFHVTYRNKVSKIKIL